MYARYVIHLASETCYVYPDNNSINETTEDVHEWAHMDILWILSWIAIPDKDVQQYRIQLEAQQTTAPAPPKATKDRSQ